MANTRNGNRVGQGNQGGRGHNGGRGNNGGHGNQGGLGEPEDHGVNQGLPAPLLDTSASQLGSRREFSAVESVLSASQGHVLCHAVCVIVGECSEFPGS
jgi:hypothetical protein